MKKQIKIALLSLWGGIAFPIGYLHELADDKIIPMWGWLQFILGTIMFISIWVWFLPALGCAKILGVCDRLYELEIIAFPKHPFGWILPAILWFIIFNLIALAIRKIKRKKDLNVNSSIELEKKLEE
ncbi:hypothetical protein ACFLS1_12490 [Verrucomicrobiota bacterium]